MAYTKRCPHCRKVLAAKRTNRRAAKMECANVVALIKQGRTYAQVARISGMTVAQVIYRARKWEALK